MGRYQAIVIQSDGENKLHESVIPSGDIDTMKTGLKL
jgi:hypothetical protein